MAYRYDERQKGLQPGDTKGAVLLYGPRPGASSYADIKTGSIPAGSAQGDKSGSPFGIGEARDKAIPAR